MVTMEMISGQLLPAFLVHKGVLFGRLMKEQQKRTKSTCVFTESHWMTEETAILYLQFVTAYFPQKIIGLVWDKAPAHTSGMVDKWIEDFNKRMKDEGKRTRLVVEFIDNCLTAIYQPCDVVVIGILKKILHRKYHEMLGDMIESGVLAPGDMLKISREDLTQWMQEAVDEINDKQAEAGYNISKAFPKCGLDF